MTNQRRRGRFGVLIEEQVLQQNHIPGDPFNDDGIPNDSQACLVCGCQSSEGLHILTRFLCTTCETSILKTEADHERYHYFVDRLRQLWRDMEKLLNEQQEQEF